MTLNELAAAIDAAVAMDVPDTHAMLVTHQQLEAEQLTAMRDALKEWKPGVNFCIVDGSTIFTAHGFGR